MGGGEKSPLPASGKRREEMKIILKSLLATAEGIFYPEQIYDIDDEKAKNLIKKGYAVAVEKRQDVETEQIEYEAKKVNIRNKKAK